QWRHQERVQPRPRLAAGTAPRTAAVGGRRLSRGLRVAAEELLQGAIHGREVRNLVAVRSRWLIAGLLLLAPDAWAADPWHLPGWQARAIVEIPKPLAEPGVDTAGVKVLCQGRAKPDGSDYRVLDAAGKPVPFQLTFHDAARYSLISFHAENPQQR